MSRNSGIFMLLSTMLVLSSCKKEDPPGFEIEQPTLVSVSHDELVVKVEYKFENYNNYLSGGIFWSETPNPTANDNTITSNSIKNETISYKLDNIFGNTNYYIVAWLDTPQDGSGNGGGRIYSHEVSFKTDQTPDVDCAFISGQVDFDVFNFTMSPLVIESSGPDYTQLRSTYDYGYIDFYFKEYPKSAIYHTYGFYTSLEEKQCCAILHHQSSWTCVYQGPDFQQIHVINDGLGGLRINFCDLGLSTSGGCAPAGFTLDGEITN